MAQGTAFEDRDARRVGTERWRAGQTDRHEAAVLAVDHDVRGSRCAITRRAGSASGLVASIARRASPTRQPARSGTCSARRTARSITALHGRCRCRCGTCLGVIRQSGSGSGRRATGLSGPQGCRLTRRRRTGRREAGLRPAALSRSGSRRVKPCSRRRSLRRRQPHDEVRPSTVVVHRLDVAPVQLDEVLDDRQPEPRAARLT